MLLLIRAIYSVVSWYVFRLFVVLVKLSVLAKCMARKTPLGKPRRGDGIVFIKPRLKSVYDLLGLMYSQTRLISHSGDC